MKRRAAGTGQVEALGPNRFRARLQDSGKLVSLGVWPSYEEADSVLDAARSQLVTGAAAPVGGMIFGAYGAQWLDDLERGGRQSVASVRYSWAKHVEKSELATLHLGAITRSDVKAWQRGLEGLGRGSIRNITGYVRQCLEAAVDEQLIEANPAAFRKKRKTQEVESDADGWTYLTPEEQRAIVQRDDIPAADRLVIELLWCTGLRIGELCALEDGDLIVEGEDPRVIVRRSKPGGKTTKGKRFRTVPLFGRGLLVAREWLRIRSAYARRNPKGLAFPFRTGSVRTPDHPFGRRQDRSNVWHAYVKAAGILRRVRIHDLRHTCGSSLVAGWWGKPWSLLAVRDYLGHSSVKLTERYAHLAPSALRQVADDSVANPTRTPRLIADLPICPHPDDDSRTSA